MYERTHNVPVLGVNGQSPGIVPAGVNAAGNTVVAVFDVTALSRLSVEIGLATQAFDAFGIDIKLAGSENWLPIASAGADYTTPKAPLLRASGDLTALAAGAKGFFQMDTQGIAFVRYFASAAVDGAVVTTIACGD